MLCALQAGRRHKRYKKSKKRLLALKGMVPLHAADAAKLRKLGFKKRWWYGLKA
jgi:ribosomal protein L35